LKEKEINGVEYMVRNKLGKQLPIWQIFMQKLYVFISFTSH
jgi:hypothetical protein